MALTSYQQIQELLGKSENILVTFSKNYNADSLSAAVALGCLLKKLNKKYDLVCADNSFPDNLHFLKESKQVKNELENLRKFIINLDISRTAIKEFSYDVKDQVLSIYITPKKGFFNTADLNTKASNFRYDLIIVLDTVDLESLGEIFTENTEFFYNVPLINIDHSAQNEFFGQINLVELPACSTTEVLYNFMVQAYKEYLDASMATALLTGIIYKTRSFKKNSVSPRCLNIAGDLIGLGAQKEEIVANLYHRKNVNQLQVWGKILANLKIRDNKKLVYSYLTQEDFATAAITHAQMVEVIDDLLINMPEAQIILLSYQSAAYEIMHTVFCSEKHDALQLTKAWNSRGTKSLVTFKDNTFNLEQSQQEVLKEIEKRLLVNNV